VPLGDVKAYAAAIDKLFSDNDLYMKYATAGKERIIKMFTSEKSNKEADVIFKELIDL
jgi:glycosyltransferase involved in cell wall biosynthesis